MPTRHGHLQQRHIDVCAQKLSQLDIDVCAQELCQYDMDDGHEERLVDATGLVFREPEQDLASRWCEIINLESWVRHFELK